MSAAGLPEGQLVLDFDGVLCESADESVQVIWCAHTGAPVEAFFEAAVPDDVVARFRRLRPYMRHLPHFLVALLDGPEPVGRAEFNACFDALPAGLADGFDESARAFRNAVREHDRAGWLARHVIDPRVALLVHDAYIATARDSVSVVELLGANGVRVDPERIFGLLRTKPWALARIAAREGLAADQVWLLDDCIDNCVAAREAGFGAAWASWGYHEPGDEAVARAAGVAVVELDDLHAKIGR